MKFNEARKIAEAIKESRKEIDGMVDVMGTMALNHFTLSFRNQGFTDEHLEKWEPRKRSSYKTKRGKTINDTTRAILVGKGSGKLRRSLRKLRRGNYAVVIRSGGQQDNYANVHNEGLRAGRGSGFRMPKRQFVGYSGTLNRKIISKFNAGIKRIFKQ